MPKLQCFLTVMLSSILLQTSTPCGGYDSWSWLGPIHWSGFVNILGICWNLLHNQQYFQVICCSRHQWVFSCHVIYTLKGNFFWIISLVWVLLILNLGRCWMRVLSLMFVLFFFLDETAASPSPHSPLQNFTPNNVLEEFFDHIHGEIFVDAWEN